MGSSWIRLIAAGALAVGFWALARYGTLEPGVVPASAPASQFSAVRAAAMLGRVLGPQVPHPAGTTANRAVRARLLATLAQMGIVAHTYRGMGCFTDKNAPVIGCGNVVDVVAPVLPGRGKAILMVAHYDSVPAGPGAADDGSGVAALLETARALRARPGKIRHPVIALFTNGEEYGMLGAAAYLQNPALRSRIGIAINVEARGNRGPSLLFQTSPKASQLIALYARTAPSYATSSLYAEIYRFMPNDTDLTVFLHHHIAGYNFAIARRVAHYHTPLDTLANLSRRSLQDQGDNLLGLVRVLENQRWSSLDGHAEDYISILGRWLARWPQSFSLPLAIILGLLVVLAAMAAAGRLSVRHWFAAVFVFPGTVAGAGLAGWAMVAIAQAVSSMPDPSYAHPTALRVALALIIAAVVMIAARLTSARVALVGVWIWFSAIAIAVAALLPGFSPYFLLPLAAALLTLPIAHFAGFERPFGQLALFLSALVALVIWLQLCVDGESLMGLRLHLLFTLPAAIGVATLLPWLASATMSRRVFVWSVSGAVVLGCTAAVAAGLMPSYSRMAPQRLNLYYVSVPGRSLWAAQTSAPLPREFYRVAAFSRQAEPIVANYPYRMFLAPAPHLSLAPAGATVKANERRDGHRSVTLALHASAAMLTLRLPGHLNLKEIEFGTTSIAIPPGWKQQKQVAIGCLTPDCSTATVRLVMDQDGPFVLTLVARSLTLPGQAKPLLAARPASAVRSGYGDGTLEIVPIAVAGAN
ncbi:MAG: M20/M25/M40 family metallo-hydrolase [Alphaproteobacteria bacterium]|nr:M20/M25/M40 family metallo-hydrolase [Alphaproteobacteria bacterium]